MPFSLFLEHEALCRAGGRMIQPTGSVNDCEPSTVLRHREVCRRTGERDRPFATQHGALLGHGGVGPVIGTTVWSFLTIAKLSGLCAGVNPSRSLQNASPPTSVQPDGGDDRGSGARREAHSLPCYLLLGCERVRGAALRAFERPVSSDYLRGSVAELV